jgi:ABC-type uncharacterized transport system permease subunit
VSDNEVERGWGVIICGAFSGLGGAYMSVCSAGIFVPMMVAGQGFMCIVIAMLARGKAIWVVVGALLFGVAVSITTALQLIGVVIDMDVVNMLPFIVVMLALIVLGRRAGLPEWLCKTYKRGMQ